MKKLIITIFSLLLFAGCSATPDQEDDLDTEPVEEIVEEAGPCRIVGTWKMNVPGEEGTLYVTGVFNSDGTDEGDFCVGTADSISAQIVGLDINATVPLDTGYFGIYRMDGDSVVVDAENMSSTFTGAFTDDTHIVGTWENHGRGTEGTFTAEKISD